MGINGRKMRVSVTSILLMLTLVGFGFSPPASASEPPRDLKGHLTFSSSVLKEVEAGQYDLLEAQYWELRNCRETLADGMEKLWVYFAGFYGRYGGIKIQEEADNFTQPVRAWLAARPKSIAAFLCLSNALIGQIDWLRGQMRAGSGNSELVAKVKALAEEHQRTLRDFPEEMRAKLKAEPYYYTVAVQFLSCLNAPVEMIEQVGRDEELVDPYSMPFCSVYTVWLFKVRANNASLPRPEVWLTDRCQITPLDTEELAARKARVYAEIVAFHGDSKFNLSLFDWPTLKAGLRGLVKDFGAETDWPSRYLVLAYGKGDKEAAREALEVIQGNYSPEVIGMPIVFQDMSVWADEP
jgi:hypothetical protein